MKTPVLAFLFASAMALSGIAHAQVHEGDIEMSLVGNRITLAGNDAFHANGLAVFEGDFGDFAGGPDRTDDPGFDSAVGTFAAGTLINYTAMGSLQFWNGSSWQSAVPSFEFVRLDGNLGEDTRWTSAGTMGDMTGLIGQAGATGEVHEHLDFSVARTGGGVPAVGAYLIQLQITSPSHISSAPFYLALNRGLSAGDFEVAVAALAVPEPQTWLLLGLGLLAVSLRSNQRRAR